MKKIISLTVVAILLCVAQINTVFAAYDKIKYLTDDEIFNDVWELYYTENYDVDMADTFYFSLMISISYGELSNFVKDYTSLNDDTTVNDVKKDYYIYLEDDLGYGSKIEFGNDDGKCYEYKVDEPDVKYYWSYNEDTDKFVCTDTNNKIVKTYNRYYLPDEDKDAALNENNGADNSVDSEESNKTAVSEQKQIVEEETISEQENGQVVTISPTANISSTSEASEEVAEEIINNSSVWNVILIVIGVIVICFIIAIIIRIKKNNEDKK
jgi:hypothetical protein